MKRTAVLRLFEALLADASRLCCTPLVRDLTLIRSRIEKEGDSFFTITLPSFAKDFERCLELGRIEPSLFRPFRKVSAKKGGVIPAFLQGILSQLFDREGTLRKNHSVEPVEAIRQICLVFNKVTRECTDARKAKALQAYVSCENDLRSFRFHAWPYRNRFLSVANIAFGGLLNHVQRKLYDGKLVPKHGPGAVVERLSANQKFASDSWTKRLERYLPGSQYRYVNINHWISEGLTGDLLSKDEEKPVKVIFVPKTAKTPRVIAIEPSHMQYAQQSIMRELVNGIESDSILKSSIHFTDSSINGEAARKASIDRQYATLDMSEASDRIHAGLAYNMIKSSPDLARAIFSCRSMYALLPNKEVIPLVKFASMGSALCFPIESMVFYTIAIAVLIENRGLPLTRDSVARMSNLVHVFGDDLIIPSHDVPRVIEVIESTRLKVNKSKTFVLGSFRESCGVDAYQGYNVTPIYIRRSLNDYENARSDCISHIATANLFYKKGWWTTCRMLREYVTRKIGSVPHTGDNSPSLGWHSFNRLCSIERWNSVLHRFEHQGIYLRCRSESDPIDGYARLLKFFLKRGEEVSRAEEDYDGEEDHDGYHYDLFDGCLRTVESVRRPFSYYRSKRGVGCLVKTVRNEEDPVERNVCTRRRPSSYNLFPEIASPEDGKSVVRDTNNIKRRWMPAA